jgi:hypothetical protein
MHNPNTEGHDIERVEITVHASESLPPDAPGERERDEIRRKMRGGGKPQAEAPSEE